MVFNFILVGVIGMIVGYIALPHIIRPGRPSGEIRFYKLDPDEPPVMTAELYKEPDDICKRKYIVFKVTRS